MIKFKKKIIIVKIIFIPSLINYLQNLTSKDSKINDFYNKLTDLFLLQNYKNGNL